MKKGLNLRNKIVRTSTHAVLGLTIASFYGWFMASVLEKIFF